MSIGYGDIYLGHKSVFGKLYRVTDPHVFLVSFALIANAETILWQYSFASGTEWVNEFLKTGRENFCGIDTSTTWSHWAQENVLRMKSFHDAL